jgi:hypothetical protein
MKGPIGRWFILAALIAGLGSSAGAGDRLKSLWVYWAPQKILFTPTVAWDGSVYIATADNLIRGISPDGAAMWSANPGGLPSAAMALQGNVLYFPISDHLVAMGTDGRLGWRVALGSTLCSTPAVAADGTIYETLVKGGIVALNPQGRILWSYMMSDPVVTSPAITHTGLIFVTSTQHVYLLAPQGTPVAIFPLPDPPISPMALDADDYPYFWGATGAAFALFQNGTLHWQTEAPSGGLIPTGGSPVASTSAVFLTSSLGTPPPKTHSVSGTVKDATGTGLAGVTISSGTGNPTATTASNGTYSLGLADGTYTLTPSLSTYTFNPTTLSVTVNGADVKGNDFVARLFSAGIGGAVFSAGGDSAVPEASTVTYNAGAYSLSTGTAVWTPLEVGGPHSPVVASEGLFLLPSYGDQKIYLINQATGVTEGTADVGGPPGDLVLADTAQGTRLYFQAGDQALHCFSSTLTPEPTSPWTQIGGGSRHLYRRDDPPTVELTSPEDGASVTGAVPLVATASDDFAPPNPDPKIRFLVDGVAVANDSSSSPQWDTTTFPNGAHTVQAEARDSAGNVARSQVTVTVNNDSPRSQDIYADDSAITFTWDAGTETKFRVEVSTNGAFKPVLVSSETLQKPWLTDTSWKPSSQIWTKILGAAKNAGTSDVTLVWRVVGKTAGPMAGSGGFLVLQGIEASTLLTPSNGQSEDSSTPPVFTWTPKHTGKFQVRVSDTSGFTVLRMTSKLPNHTWLDKATWTPAPDKWSRTAKTYKNRDLYWEVISKDDIGRTVESAVFHMHITG